MKLKLSSCFRAFLGDTTFCQCDPKSRDKFTQLHFIYRTRNDDDEEMYVWPHNSVDLNHV